MVKKSNIFIGLKKTCLGVLDREDREKDNETGLKERGGIKMSTTVFHYAMHAPSLKYIPISWYSLSFSRLVRSTSRSVSL